MIFDFFLKFFFILEPYKYVLQYGFSEPATIMMVGIIDLHHTIFFYLIVVFFIVSWLMFYLIYFNSTFKKIAYFNHCPTLEIIWTIFPSFIIGAILVPSLSLLHASDELVDPELTLKVIGHQWYWSYEYSDFNTYDPISGLTIDSYIKSNWMNLLADPIIILPARTVIRFLITSADVIHSWAVPSWGVKMDAIPGRLNQVITTVYKNGIYYGQCSELCGAGHGFMPITIEVLPARYYYQWLYEKNFMGFPTDQIPYSSTGLHEFISVQVRVNKKKHIKFMHEMLDAMDFDSSVKEKIDERYVVSYTLRNILPKKATTEEFLLTPITGPDIS